jgi:transcriptional regulator GlxA family with amidase domain
MRVNQMARLLCSTDLSIAETARAVGWTDAKYASRCFHTAYGMSPTEFRRQHLPTLRAALDSTVAVTPTKEDAA